MRKFEVVKDEFLKYDLKKDSLRIKFNLVDLEYEVRHGNGIVPYESLNRRTKKILNKKNGLLLKNSQLLEQEKEQAVGSERKSKIGTGDRSEKIRTYNYPQNRVTDHRINFSTMTLDRVMDGELDPIIEALQTEDLRLKLAGETFE